MKITRNKLLDLINSYFKTFYPIDINNINPLKINEIKSKIIIVILSYFIFRINNPFEIINCRFNEIIKWYQFSIKSKSLFSNILDILSFEEKTFLENQLNLLENDFEFEISGLYEELVGIELIHDNNNNLSFDFKNNNYRNKLGSYYTPKNVADKIVKQTLDMYLIQNKIKVFDNQYKINKDKILEFLTNISYADFSCGDGRFLLSILSYYIEIFSNLKLDNTFIKNALTIIVNNIYGYDVDCIALEIAIFEILFKVKDLSIYSKVKEHFKQGNVLLQSIFESTEQEKRDTFFQGFIYHSKLGIKVDNLTKFDIILGNPPWEKIRFEEKKFFAIHSHQISKQNKKNKRKFLIDKLSSSGSSLSKYFHLYKNELEKSKNEIKHNDFFTLSNKGELNTYALFTELSLRLRKENGIVSLIVKSSLVTSKSNMKIFNYLTENRLLKELFDFSNKNRLFNIDSRERFCLLILINSNEDNIKLKMNLTSFEQINELNNELRIKYQELELLNPITKMVPNVTSNKDLDILLNLHRTNKIFKDVYKKAKFGRLVHFTSHADFITEKSFRNNVPIYEGKFFYQFDSKFSGFNNISLKDRYTNKAYSNRLLDSYKKEDDYLPESRFFIDGKKWKDISKNYDSDYMLAWRSLTSPTNARTCIATILPFMPTSQSIQFLIEENIEMVYLLGLFNSIIFDFIIKVKISGIDLTQTIIKQTPIPNEDIIDTKIEFDGFFYSIKNHIIINTLKLIAFDSRLSTIINLIKEKINFNNIYSSNWGDRKNIIRNIDALIALAYRLKEEDILYVFSKFSKTYNKEDLEWINNFIELNYSISST